VPKKISTIKPIILDHAIALFGDRGHDGVTTRDVASAAGVTEGSIYRLFKSKKNLYRQSVEDASRRAGERMGQMLRNISGNPSFTPRQRLAQTLLAWFHCFPRADARVFHQVLKQVHPADRKLKTQAETALSEIVAIVTGLLQGNGAITNPGSCSASCRAEIIVLALFQHKTMQAASQLSKAEIQAMDALVTNWIDLVAPQ
jgi:AcrR family transcriptional regulator